MNQPPLIHLGFEVGTGIPISIPLKHMAVTGQTQESGKTTALEALSCRLGNTKALAFLTKRGEKSFDAYHSIPPFFQERADWEFVESILESTMHQRMKFERAWVLRACKGAKTLADVQRNTVKLQSGAKRSMDQDMYMLLGEYLQKVVPLLARLPKLSSREFGGLIINLWPALNVMDLRPYPEELQFLVISSVLRWIHAERNDIVTIIPEAWKFCPQGRNTPVKVEVERLAREGAGVGNYIWIDSQDMAGVDKLVLRAASVWLVGVQREMNELQRALGNIPAGIKRPKAEDVAQLQLGQFYACWQNHIHKVYVQPAWLDEGTAIAVAKGLLKAEGVEHAIQIIQQQEDKEMDEKLIAENKELRRQIVELRAQLAERQADALPPNTSNVIPPPPSAGSTAFSPVRVIGELIAERRPAATLTGEKSLSNTPSDLEAIYDYVRQRLLTDPKVLRVLAVQPSIEVSVEIARIDTDTKTLQGRLALLIHDGFFDKPVNGNTVFREMQRIGFKTANPNVYRELDKLLAMGFLVHEGKEYVAAPGMKKNIARK